MKNLFYGKWRGNMTFDEVITNFMNRVETDKANGTSITYKRKIYVFQEYVKYFDRNDKRTIGGFIAVLC